MPVQALPWSRPSSRLLAPVSYPWRSMVCAATFYARQWCSVFVCGVPSPCCPSSPWLLLSPAEFAVSSSFGKLFVVFLASPLYVRVVCSLSFYVVFSCRCLLRFSFSLPRKYFALAPEPCPFHLETRCNAISCFGPPWRFFPLLCEYAGKAPFCCACSAGRKRLGPSRDLHGERRETPEAKNINELRSGPLISPGGIRRIFRQFNAGARSSTEGRCLFEIPFVTLISGPLVPWRFFPQPRAY